MALALLSSSDSSLVMLTIALLERMCQGGKGSLSAKASPGLQTRYSPDDDVDVEKWTAHLPKRREPCHPESNFTTWGAGNLGQGLGFGLGYAICAQATCRKNPVSAGRNTVKDFCEP